MKKLLILLLLTLNVFADPQLKANVKADTEGNLYFIITPNKEVDNIILWTPIDPGIQMQNTPEMVIALKIPDQLPLWPELVFIVNGNEIHKTNSVELKPIWEAMQTALTKF